MSLLLIEKQKNNKGFMYY
ncbi:Hypothetical protein KK9_0878 [Borreliella garinii BgVir]|uniref:Uncharacterized protein n=1 Tax=Borrelia garinii subsp. bavariensis (strain ATCC BAA-2496 / DSM 23469 / PBi) TaxID=290434 RepID=A0A7I6GX39_BORGP|nr:hypothetical protein BG0864 [Borreliella bavariensis PBi]AEW69169.1 Hypothetical protein KK9_0878 [Borreliella garinii BgVir]